MSWYLTYSTVWNQVLKKIISLVLVILSMGRLQPGNLLINQSWIYKHLKKIVCTAYRMQI